MRIIVLGGYFLFLVWSQLLMAQLPNIMWHFDTNDMSFGMAALADVDDDGYPEIAFSTYRNDERIIVLNAEDGNVLWEYNTGGCNDVAPLIFDVDADDELEIVLAGSCNPKTFCFDAATGNVEWVTNTHGSDSPPTVADLDNDGLPEILHGEFGGWVLCLNGEDGSVLWNHLVDGNSWIQTAPTVLDIDGDEYLDFVVGNWNFGEDHRLFAYRGLDHKLLWETSEPDGVMYHGASHADLDGDGLEELVIGDYSGKLMVLNAENGQLAWDFSFDLAYSFAAPTCIADLDLDGDMEIICIDWFQLGVLDHQGNLVWKFNIPGNSSSFRGCAVSDVNNDSYLDLVFATGDGHLYGVNGITGQEIWSVDLRNDIGMPDFEFDHAPVIADFDGDELLDVFVVGGHAVYPAVQNNYGRAYALSLDSKGGPDWPMFRRDARRTACVCDQQTSLVKQKEETKPKLIYKDQRINLINGRDKELLVELFSVTGQLIDLFTIQTTKEVANLPAGMCFYRLVTKEGQLSTGKIFVGGF